jgi:Tfp pilus assembly protein PilF
LCFVQDFDDAWNNKGILLNALGKFEDALTCFDEAVEINGNQADVWFNKGYTHSVLGQLDEAVGSFKEAIEIDPNFEAAYMEIAFAYVQMGCAMDAVEMYDKSIELNPSAEAYFGRAVCLQAAGDLEKAKESFEKAFELDPRYKELVEQKLTEQAQN